MRCRCYDIKTVSSLLFLPAPLNRAPSARSPVIFRSARCARGSCQFREAPAASGPLLELARVRAAPGSPCNIGPEPCAIRAVPLCGVGQSPLKEACVPAQWLARSGPCAAWAPLAGEESGQALDAPRQPQNRAPGVWKRPSRTCDNGDLRWGGAWITRTAALQRCSPRGRVLRTRIGLDALRHRCVTVASKRGPA